MNEKYKLHCNYLSQRFINMNYNNKLLDGLYVLMWHCVSRVEIVAGTEKGEYACLHKYMLIGTAHIMAHPEDIHIVLSRRQEYAVRHYFGSGTLVLWADSFVQFCCCIIIIFLYFFFFFSFFFISYPCATLWGQLSWRCRLRSHLLLST